MKNKWTYLLYHDSYTDPTPSPEAPMVVTIHGDEAPTPQQVGDLALLLGGSGEWDHATAFTFPSIHAAMNYAEEDDA